MPLTRQQKEERVKQSVADLKAATSIVFLSYNALGVTDMEELRDKLHAQGARLRVLPKRLLKLVVEATGLSFDPVSVTGQLGVVWGSDAVAPAKVVHSFAKDRDTIVVLSGALDGQALSLDQVYALALLPSREELLGKLVASLASPARGLVMVLSGVQRQTVQILKAIADQKQTA